MKVKNSNILGLIHFTTATKIELASFYQGGE